MSAVKLIYVFKEMFRIIQSLKEIFGCNLTDFFFGREIVQICTNQMVLQLEVLFFKTESLKQIFDISTNINDDYKIIDVHFKKFIGCTWTRNCSGKNCIVTLIGTSIIINSL